MVTLDFEVEAEYRPFKCPIYNMCRTGRDLLEVSCTRYKCNTFYIRFPEFHRHKTYSPFSKNGDDRKA